MRFDRKSIRGIKKPDESIKAIYFGYPQDKIYWISPLSDGWETMNFNTGFSGKKISSSPENKSLRIRRDSDNYEVNVSISEEEQLIFSGVSFYGEPPTEGELRNLEYNSFFDNIGNLIENSDKKTIIKITDSQGNPLDQGTTFNIQNNTGELFINPDHNYDISILNNSNKTLHLSSSNKITISNTKLKLFNLSFVDLENLMFDNCELYFENCIFYNVKEGVNLINCVFQFINCVFINDEKWYSSLVIDNYIRSGDYLEKSYFLNCTISDIVVIDKAPEKKEELNLYSSISEDNKDILFGDKSTKKIYLLANDGENSWKEVNYTGTGLKGLGYHLGGAYVISNNNLYHSPDPRTNGFSPLNLIQGRYSDCASGFNVDKNGNVLNDPTEIFGFDQNKVFEISVSQNTTSEISNFFGDKVLPSSNDYLISSSPGYIYLLSPTDVRLYEYDWELDKVTLLDTSDPLINNFNDLYKFCHPSVRFKLNNHLLKFTGEHIPQNSFLPVSLIKEYDRSFDLVENQYKNPFKIKAIPKVDNGFEIISTRRDSNIIRLEEYEQGNPIEQISSSGYSFLRFRHIPSSSKFVVWGYNNNSGENDVFMYDIEEFPTNFTQLPSIPSTPAYEIFPIFDQGISSYNLWSFHKDNKSFFLGKGSQSWDETADIYQGSTLSSPVNEVSSFGCYFTSILESEKIETFFLLNKENDNNLFQYNKDNSELNKLAIKSSQFDLTLSKRVKGVGTGIGFEVDYKDFVFSYDPDLELVNLFLSNGEDKILRESIIEPNVKDYIINLDNLHYKEWRDGYPLLQYESVMLEGQYNSYDYFTFDQIYNQMIVSDWRDNCYILSSDVQYNNWSLDRETNFENVNRIQGIRLSPDDDYLFVVADRDYDLDQTKLLRYPISSVGDLSTLSTSPDQTIILEGIFFGIYVVREDGGNKLYLYLQKGNRSEIYSIQNKDLNTLQFEKVSLFDESDFIVLAFSRDGRLAIGIKQDEEELTNLVVEVYTDKIEDSISKIIPSEGDKPSELPYMLEE